MAGRPLAHGGASTALDVRPGVSAENAAFLQALGLGHTTVTPEGAPVPHPSYVDYSREPARPPVLRVNKDKPYNAEPALSDINAQGFITSDKYFLARSHGPIPLYKDPSKEWSLTIDGLVGAPLTLSLDDIKNSFEKVTVTMTVQCAGNRRNDFTRNVRKVKGVGWEAGALSTGVFAGARLRDVLIRAKVQSAARHVAFEGDDNCVEEMFGVNLYFKYQASISIHKAMDAMGDVILAYEMNGAPLSRDRGFPLRVVVPGYIGARSVKWLRHISVQTYDSDRFHQRLDYKIFSPSVDWNNVKPHWLATVPIQELNVQTVITAPIDGQNLGCVPYTIRGYAIAGAGRRIERVDLSLDGGYTWVVADLDRHGQDYGPDVPRHWAWTLWHYNVHALPSPCEIVCKSFDSSGNTQPESAAPIYNLRGVLYNAWHRILVNAPVLHQRRADEKATAAAALPKADDKKAKL